MSRLIGRRLALSLPLLFAVAASTFLLVALIPGDVARTIVGPNGTAEQYESLRVSLGLDEPLAERYREWLTGAAQGDLGVSLFSQESVASLLGSRLPVTDRAGIGRWRAVPSHCSRRRCRPSAPRWRIRACTRHVP